MKVKVLEKVKSCMPTVYKKGDWIDLITAEDTTIEGPTISRLYKSKKVENRERTIKVRAAKISLGVAMQLPKGYEALVVPRSSTFNRYNIIQANSVGIIDESYCGDTDIWKLPIIAFQDTVIPAGIRIAQFRIQLSQKATMWQKIKW